MYIKTNLGEIPVEDYLDIMARQYGYEDYEELRNDGLVIENKNLYEHIGRAVCDGRIY